MLSLWPVQKISAEPAQGSLLRKENKITETITVRGVGRKFVFYLPDKATLPPQGFPVVFVFHGGRGTALSAQAMSKMHQVGLTEGFIVVYPEGLYKSWNTDIISTAASKNNVDDVAFFNQMLDYFITHYAIDRHRVYVCGISNGGHISYYLTKKSGERIAALAVVASGLASEENFQPPQPRPIMVIHGTEDKFIPYKGGQGERDWYLPVETIVQQFITLNGASAAAQPYVPYSGFKKTKEVDTFYYEGGPEGEDVVFIRINGAGHTWPGGGGYIDFLLGPTSRAISASRAIWEFFKQHRLQESAQ